MFFLNSKNITTQGLIIPKIGVHLMHINRDLYLFSLHYKTAMKQAKIILTFLLSFANEDWVISKVVNKDGDVTIFGDNYTLDGTPIITNHRLDLNNLRRLDAF